MSRIPAMPREGVGLFRRLAYRYARQRFGAVPEPFAVAAHHGGLFAAGAVHETLVEKVSRVLPANVRQLAVYRVAQRLGCSWCIDFGAMLQRMDGLDIERLAEIDNFADSARYSHAERLAIGYADAMTELPVTVTDEQVRELEAEFGRAGVLELTYHIALENMRARNNAALGIPEQGFTSGEACRVSRD
ncbi:carboxymuconolactone decarboxylase family protein [Haloechinothrix sp. LS1_15]|uniref:carboxymuconolactone decarboxylase family protein n=1 Tax=Haloechinothrix sp. LS1_15 TaxID=2652248 RepID=UPI00294493BA|nr:carboxymuconolactone decarboxylase family protein [Haloechinothrix sp. LS1_15]MDV6012106.1 carboxymuconolactone decarboxylase family protein [Haloechinothrix sp. LS1_15]